MKKNFSLNYYLFFTLLIAPLSFAQSTSEVGALDKDFLQSLPESVRKDVMDEMMDGLESKTSNLQKRPSSQLSKLDVVKDWEKFKKKQLIGNKSERYGLKLFNTMQSSFMPLNEPNFGNNYIVDYGDAITLQLYGNNTNSSYTVEVARDGTVLLEDIGSIVVAGLNFEQVTDIITQRYISSSIGINVIVNLSQIRDINILITGNVEFPGMYTLSGNSNILQALNIAGGISETGSLRRIVLKRKGEADIKVDLYQALIYGNTESIPFLMSGDSIYIEPVKNLVRAGYGFNNIAIYELMNDETLKDLISFSGGLKLEASAKSLSLVRFEDDIFTSYKITSDKIDAYRVMNLDSVYAFKEKIGTVTISGDIKHPGKYSISSKDRLLDIISRSGGYIDSAYTFGAVLLREEAANLEEVFAQKTYQNLVTYIASNPSALGAAGSGEGFAFVLSELKDYKPIGRVIAEFSEQELKNNLQDNIYLNDGDKIHIPSYSSNVYIFGEVGNPGSVLFKENISMVDYINKSGGFTRYSSSDFIFIISPNGETRKVNINGFRKFIAQDYEVFPGSVIYVPRHVGRIGGLNLAATLGPIFSSVALSIASLNSISD